MDKVLANETPMMRQYNAIKQSHPDKILFFRMGDFYEMFGDDAVKASSVLQIQLTSRDKNKENALPMCGIPAHAYEQYLNKLVNHGFKVAVCEQLEEATEAKGLVKRDVVQVITPGTITSNDSLDSSKNNYICCIHANQSGQELAIAFADLSTGELEYAYFNENAHQKIHELIHLYTPSEIITSTKLADNFTQFFDRSLAHDVRNALSCTAVDHYYFDLDRSKSEIKTHYKILSLASFGIEDDQLTIMVIGALLKYLKSTQFNELKQIKKMRQIKLQNSMILDNSTIKNLELFQQNSSDQNNHHLFKLLDQSTTAMGKRLLRKWMLRPLLDIKQINQRHDAIEELVNNSLFSSQIKQCFLNIGDIERMLSRICSAKPKIVDLIKLKQSLSVFPVFESIIKNQFQSTLLNHYAAEFNSLEELNNLLNVSIKEDANLNFKDGGYIASTFDKKLEQLRSLTTNSKQHLAQLEIKEKQANSIQNLKIKYNRIFGYYFEISNAYKGAIPEHFIRKQTLANAERYITIELKDLEEQILSAEDEIITLEKEHFLTLCEKIKDQVAEIQQSARVVALFDVLLSFALVSMEHGFIRAETHQEQNRRLLVKNGRHPVIENIEQDMAFIPNDIDLNSQEAFMMVITGPNMGGKSTYMRQIALMIYLNQIGSFVPADAAYLPIFDRIFTRVGASDNLSQGQSTFMVEMNEAASIINNATEKSLIILDEIGRGTSTFDGISIAWAIMEHLYSLGAITLFATHYHELTTLGDEKMGIVNYHVAVKEEHEEIIFLRKIIKGKSDKSYGIQVAKLAGLPHSIISNAKKIMLKLERNESELVGNGHAQKTIKHEKKSAPEPVIEKNDQLREYLNRIDINNITPFDALKHINEMIKWI